MKGLLVAALCIGVAAPVLGADRSGGPHPEAGGSQLMLRAVADLQPAAGNPVSGTVTFIQHGDRVTVIADVRGLPPNSSHGFHIHEKGDCSAPDFTSAGGHFNPGGHPHAGPTVAARHAGDLGNLEAGTGGRAYKRITVDNITLGDGPNSVINRGVIVHEKMDDLTTQPTGAAGGRIACGVIRIARDEGAGRTRR
jgi:Cu-Zn family superoxide dismutase